MNRNDEVKYHELRLLIVESLSGTISSEDLSNLEEILKADSDKRKYYIECLQIHAGLRKKFSFANTDSTLTSDDFERDLNETAFETSKLATDSNTSFRGTDLDKFNLDSDTDDSDESGLPQDMQEILKLVGTSPDFEISKEEPRLELIQKVESDFKWFPGQLNKALARSCLALVACILVFVGYIHFFFVPDPVEYPVVAKLADSIDAVWDDELSQPDEYSNMVQSRYYLKDGFAYILFNGGASVTVEAPAEFSLNSPSDMGLFTGRIYSIVPQRAHGFSVSAGSGKIVDIGTEFGVEVDVNNTAQLHVIKGKTLLFASFNEGSKKQIEVSEGKAKKVYNDGLVEDIKAQKHRFTRFFNSTCGFVWKGQPTVDLADIVRGGNGFGRGKPEVFLSIDGKFTNVRRYDIPPDSLFFEVHQSPYVDSVFIPDGGDGPVQVSSAGHFFTNCPDTVGLKSRVFFSIFSDDTLKYPDVYPEVSWPVKLDNEVCGTKDNPAITIASNSGITFDLEELRRLIGVVDIKRFTVRCGIIERDNVFNEADADIRVLVDGRERFKVLGKKENMDPSVISIDLNNNERFLTLMVTEGTDGNTKGDWVVFADPFLHLD